MIIDLAKVGTTAKRIEVEFDSSEIDLDGELIHLKDKTSFNGEIELVGAKAHLRGTIRANVLVDCTRCVEEVERVFEFRFRAIFVDSSTEDTNPDIEVSDDALDESLVPDGQIDMAEVVREQILLAVPTQNFCTEDCCGLCLKCGANLNLIDCKCADVEIDPRWAALKSLK